MSLHSSVSIFSSKRRHQSFQNLFSNEKRKIHLKVKTALSDRSHPNARKNMGKQRLFFWTTVHPLMLITTFAASNKWCQLFLYSSKLYLSSTPPLRIPTSNSCNNDVRTQLKHDIGNQKKIIAMNLLCARILKIENIILDTDTFLICSILSLRKLIANKFQQLCRSVRATIIFVMIQLN